MAEASAQPMAQQRIRERAGAKDVRLHDLRRTLGSSLAASEYELPMIGRVLNHSQPYARLDLKPDSASRSVRDRSR
jgi:integrase